MRTIRQYFHNNRYYNTWFLCAVGSISLLFFLTNRGAFSELHIFFGAAALVAVTYVLFLFATVCEFKFSPNELGANVTLSVAVYLLGTFVLLAQFLVAWLCAGGFGHAGGKAFAPLNMDFTDALYFTTMIFTTVGLGDFVAVTKGAKLFLCFQALLAVTHNVTYFSIVVMKIASTGLRLSTHIWPIPSTQNNAIQPSRSRGAAAIASQSASESPHS